MFTRSNTFGYSLFGVVYLLALSALVTLLIGGKATHQGLVLGIMALVTGALLVRRAQSARNRPLAAEAGMFIVVELVAIIAIAVNNDPAELWLATCYGVFSFLMVIESIVAGSLARYRKAEF